MGKHKTIIINNNQELSMDDIVQKCKQEFGKGVNFKKLTITSGYDVDQQSTISISGKVEDSLTVREKKAEFNKIKDFFNHNCVRCDGNSKHPNIVKDHIIPSYQGGADMPYNYQPLCASCNASKGHETTDHRLEYCKKNNLKLPEKWLPKKE